MSDLISRQEAIDVLKNRWLKTRNYEGIGEDIAEECEIYLRAVPSEQTESCEDTVSRQRLLSDLKELVVAWEKYPVMAEQIKGVEAAIGYVETIPSAQPETNDKRTETHACDCISRQAATDALRKMQTYKLFSGDDMLLIDQAGAMAELMMLPSAQPETAKRIVGKSRDGMALWYQCDMCNEPVDAQDNFCRGCGRRLTDG